MINQGDQMGNTVFIVVNQYEIAITVCRTFEVALREIGALLHEARTSANPASYRIIERTEAV